MCKHLRSILTIFLIILIFKTLYSLEMLAPPTTRTVEGIDEKYIYAFLAKQFVIFKQPIHNTDDISVKVEEYFGTNPDETKLIVSHLMYSHVYKKIIYYNPDEHNYPYRWEQETTNPIRWGHLAPNIMAEIFTENNTDFKIVPYVYEKPSEIDLRNVVLRIARYFVITPRYAEEVFKYLKIKRSVTPNTWYYKLLPVEESL